MALDQRGQHRQHMLSPEHHRHVDAQRARRRRPRTGRLGLQLVELDEHPLAALEQPLAVFVMTPIAQTRPEPAPIPGVAHATWAGHDDGLKQLSVWRQTLAPGAATPPHSHVCDEVVLCQAGQGELLIDGERHRFGPATTLVLLRGSHHQIFATGDTPLEIIGVFGGTPVGTFLPDGTALELPWRS